MFMNTDIDIFKCNLEMQNCCNLIKVDKTFILYFPKKGRIIFSMLFGVWMTVGALQIKKEIVHLVMT